MRLNSPDLVWEIWEITMHCEVKWVRGHVMINYSAGVYAGFFLKLSCPSWKNMDLEGGSGSFKTSESQCHTVEMYASAIIVFDLVMTLTFDL